MRPAPTPCLVFLLAALLWAAPGAAAPPPEGQCPAVSLDAGGPEFTDAVSVRLREGMQLSYEQLLALRQLLPDEIWGNRHVFFYQGMRMEIGSCHRRFPVPEFYTAATERFSPEVKLDRDGNLRSYVAGRPFPPEGIDPKARDAGTRWAWNLEKRYRGAGSVGHFRLVDMPSRLGEPHTYTGDFFFLQTRNRADLEATDFALPEADGNLWVAGGRFDTPQPARHLAWRQMRPKEAQTRFSESDDTFVYVPTMRKMRRAATSWVDGTYMPRYRVAGDFGGGGLPLAGSEYTGASGGINPTAGESIHQTEHLPRGFTALALRPNAYVWRVHGEREVLAPINSGRPGYPIAKNRNFGPHGLSVASDRWDVRWAVVIEGKLRRRNLDYETLTLYIDWLTGQPLYVITKADRGRILDVGISVHRFSDDMMHYPAWPGGDKASAFDPVAEVFYRVPDDSGWRRESYDALSTPPEERIRRRFTSSDYLMRGR